MGRLWDFKYLKMNYINMHKFSFKWAQLTFSCPLCSSVRSVSVFLLYYFFIYIYLFLHTCDAYGNFTA